MENFVQLPIFGILLTLLGFLLGEKIAKKINNPALTGLVVAVILIVAFLKITGISIEAYQIGGEYVNFFLGPMTLSLAVPMYHKRHILMENLLPISVGVVVSSLTAIGSGYLLGRLMGLDWSLILSMLPKNVTTGIAVETSAAIGGIPSLTVAAVTVAGVFGYGFVESYAKIARFRSPIAKGLASGAASHAMGTKRALEMGEDVGAVSSLAIALCGIVTSFLLPFVLPLLKAL
ncbi:MAG: LrgB family protein [Tissierellia bacterium]|nr:LrgB family protein [Tissierellia bacterium]